MAQREVLFLIGRGGAVLWSDASASPVALPDSRARWEAIWRCRVELEEIAHSHPLGPLGFSEEDETTMAALRSALGRLPRFSVVAPGGTIVREGAPDGVPDGMPKDLIDEAGQAPPDRVLARAEEPWWAATLRLCSGMETDDEEP